jgi:triosephosphate isomerase
MPRKYLIGGNWKCVRLATSSLSPPFLILCLQQNGTRSSVRDRVALLNKTAVDPSKLDVVVAPPSLHLRLVQQLLQLQNVAVCAQDVSATGLGAFTGEVAAEQLVDFGINWTITGHSERRAYYGETDDVVAKKTKRSLDLGLHVIFCVGETLQQREAGQTLAVLTRQTQALAALTDQQYWTQVVIAYEPVWAIGTGVVATPAQAQETHQKLRQWIARNVGTKVADSVRIIYGGSVNAKNCGELLALPDVDGFLVGGASLKPEFGTILRSALGGGEAKL